MLELEKNFYGLSETILKTCEFLELKLPTEKIVLPVGEKMPSDYFGENFELSPKLIKKICNVCKRNEKNFEISYRKFSKKFYNQKSLAQNKTDLNIFFCDYCMFSRKNLRADIDDYFDFEFYKKSPALQETFRLQIHRITDKFICNDYHAGKIFDNKIHTNEIFSDFVHRNWLDLRKCSFEEFKKFVEKSPRFFAKPIFGSMGKGAQIIQVRKDQNLKELYKSFKGERFIMEELITQHEDIKSFCPDTVNTVRINTFLDIHNDVHILTTSGRFGRVGTFVDNYSSGGHSVAINPETGIIISDGINKVHERTAAHPDTGKIFRGFQYPCWNKIQNAVREMAYLIPTVRHVGWDITINADGEVELVEANANPDIHIQQSPDCVGRLFLYKPLIAELIEYKAREIKFLGYKIHEFKSFLSAYESNDDFEDGAEFAMKKLISSCKSLLDVGCRKNKFIKTLCANDIKYFPIELNKKFSNKKADTCICVMTAEYVKNLPQFLENICNAASKQILMVCRPVDKEKNLRKRWENPFVADFTEEFLIDSMQKNNFRLHALDVLPKKNSVILYDFRAGNL